MKVFYELGSSCLVPYSQVSNKCIPLIYFSIFSNPLDLIRTHHLLLLMNFTLFTNPSFHFLSLLVQYMPTFHCKIEYSCIYFSFLLYHNLFLLFPSLYNHLNLFSSSNPLFILTSPFIKFWNFFQHPCLLEPPPPIYLALKSTWLLLISIFVFQALHISIYSFL